MITELKELGLTEYEIRVYTTLLKLGTAKGGEICRKSGVPHGKTYVALTQLADKGLITVLPMKPKLFKIIDPKKAIQFLKNKKIKEIDEVSNSILSSLKELKVTKKEEVHEKIEIKAGFEASYEYFHNIAKGAKKEVLLISRGEKVPYYTILDAKKIINRKIDFKFIIYEFNGNRKYVKRLYDLGINLRYYPTGDFALVVKDRKECFLSVRNPNNVNDRITIYFSDEVISRALAEYFYAIWKKAKPIKF